MSNPRVRKLRQSEEDVLATATRSTTTFRNYTIQSYAWGDPARPLALLFHGWEGQAGNFAALIQLLLDKGYSIKAFDAPSHGRSSTGNTSMFEYGEFASVLLDELDPTVIVSHSFGTVTAIYALADRTEHNIRQWFIVTTPFDFRERIRGIAQLLGLSSRTLTRLVDLIESDTGHKVDELNFRSMSTRLHNIREATVIHSKSDKVIPIEEARLAQAAIPNSTLIELDNIGHYAILWSDELKSILGDRLKSAGDHREQ